MAANRTHAKLDPLSFGLAIGLPWTAGVLLMAIAAGAFGWGIPFVELMGSVYLGYSASAGGAIIGALWALADGFIFGVIIAWLYNLLAQARQG